MSQKERDVLKVLHGILAGQRTQAEAARLLRISVRQVRRLQRKLQADGDGALVHGLRGKPSNRRLPADFRAKVLRAYRRRSADFGPTLASEKLAGEGLAVSRQTLRRWLIEEGLWQRKRRRDVHRSRRPRRACFGELVKLGPAALPRLVAHLSDKRRTRMASVYPTLGGYGRTFDINPRVEKEPKPPKDAADVSDSQSPPRPTVGDLCYVALGQIVNRDFSAVRYIPSLQVAVDSPTHSRALHEGVKARWGSMTPEKHKASLLADFLKPDSESRLVGACLRLASYYPEALEPVALKLLAQPTYDFWGVYEFVRQELYKAKDPKECRRLFDAYLRRHGEASREGIMRRLFDDLDTLEAHEENRRSSPLTEFGDQPRKLLIQLYGKKKGVRSKDRPPYLETHSSNDVARLIEEGLTHDDSVKIDKAVRDLLVSTRSDSLALACMQRLTGRVYDALIEDYCRRRLPQLRGTRKEHFQAMLDRIGCRTTATG
ncbi:MAG TPA: helix-turn-helix domain-containing protein [Gemmataceae bacterium]|nr:helix-turn-helix domain-containing protein [Gemmataceae bacterium]